MSALLLPEDVAAELRVTKRHVLRLARTGDLPSVRVGRYIRFERADVDTYRASQRHQPPAPQATVRTLGAALGQVTRKRPA